MVGQMKKLHQAAPKTKKKIDLVRCRVSAFLWPRDFVMRRGLRDGKTVPHGIPTRDAQASVLSMQVGSGTTVLEQDGTCTRERERAERSTEDFSKRGTRPVGEEGPTLSTEERFRPVTPPPQAVSLLPHRDPFRPSSIRGRGDFRPPRKGRRLA